MSTEIAVAEPREVQYTPEDIQLIMDTVAKGASEKEFKLFMYRAKVLGLDPLKPGTIHFVKYGNSPGSIIIGIEGFRSRAMRTGKCAGIKRGIIRDKAGKCIGAWAEVYRSDWQHPAREEVSLAEYNTGRALWAKMPETMIKKVAEAAALRMAFPDQLGGVYSDDEMEQAKVSQGPDTQPRDERAAGINQTVPILSTPPPAPISPQASKPEAAADKQSAAASGNGCLIGRNHKSDDDPGEFVINIGKRFKGKRIKDIPAKDLIGFVDWLNEEKGKKPVGGPATEFLQHAELYLERVMAAEADVLPLATEFAEGPLPFEPEGAH